MDENRKLTPRQECLVSLLVAGHTQRSASQEVGISEGTAARWLSEEHMRQALREGMNRVRQEAEMLLSGALGEAVNALLDVLRSEETASVVRVNAARAVLDFGLKYREQGELSDRITELESKVLK